MPRKTHSRYIEYILKVNSFYRDGAFKIVSEYQGDSDRITVEDEFGLLELNAGKLLLNRRPSIRCASDKNEYFKNKIRKVYGETLDLSNVDYQGSDQNIKIICSIHGEFEIDPQYLISKKVPGCIKCKILKGNNTKNNGGWSIKDWIVRSENNKNFQFFKMYIIRCWNDDEEFFKIGRTFTTIPKRFSSGLPYNYEIIQFRESEDGHKIYCLEKAFKRHNKEYKYIPKIDFHGKQECFTKIIDINNGEEIN